MNSSVLQMCIMKTKLTSLKNLQMEASLKRSTVWILYAYVWTYTSAQRCRLKCTDFTTYRIMCRLQILQSTTAKTNAVFKHILIHICINAHSACFPLTCCQYPHSSTTETSLTSPVIIETWLMGSPDHPWTRLFCLCCALLCFIYLKPLFIRWYENRELNWGQGLADTEQEECPVKDDCNRPETDSEARHREKHWIEYCARENGQICMDETECGELCEVLNRFL